MNSQTTRFATLVVLSAVVLVPSAFSQRSLGKKTGPTSKIYLAEVKGESRVVTGERIFAGRQATAFDAPGTIIETRADSHNAFVYSNGTGLFVDSDTRVEIDRFVQEPFLPDRNTTEMEPSVSQSSVFVARGFVGICTSQMVSGSSMTYSTPHAAVNIRGRRVGIQTNSNETTIYLLEGDITVRAGGGRDVGGQMLRPGEQAVIRPGLPGQPPSVTISPIPSEVVQSLDDRVNVACNARKTVTFETIERRAEAGPAGDDPEVAAGSSESGSEPAGADDPSDTEQEIVARPTVPAEVPTNIVVSPDRLPGRG